MVKTYSAAAIHGSLLVLPLGGKEEEEEEDNPVIMLQSCGGPWKPDSTLELSICPLSHHWPCILLWNPSLAAPTEGLQDGLPILHHDVCLSQQMGP